MSAKRMLLVDAKAAEGIRRHIINDVDWDAEPTAERWVRALTPEPEGEARDVTDERRYWAEETDRLKRDLAAAWAERDRLRAALLGKDEVLTERIGQIRWEMAKGMTPWAEIAEEDRAEIVAEARLCLRAAARALGISDVGKDGVDDARRTKEST